MDTTPSLHPLIGDRHLLPIILCNCTLSPGHKFLIAFNRQLESSSMSMLVGMRRLISVVNTPGF